MIENNIIYKYSIHTLELHSELTPNDYDTFYSLLGKLDLSIEKTIFKLKKIRIPNENKLYTYRHFGIHSGINSIKLLTCKNDCFTNRYIQIYINPYNVVCTSQNTGAGIIAEEQIRNAMDTIQAYLTSLFPFFPFNAYTLKRLDFCLDIKYPTQIQADEYIKLLKKSIPRKILKEKKYFNKTQRRFIPYEDSLMLECKSYAFEVYPKHRQMKICKRKGADTTVGITRLELRASKSKIKQLAVKYRLPQPTENVNTFITRSPEITRKEIPDMISGMTGTGTFHTYNYIMNQIYDSNYKQHIKDKMMLIEIGRAHV